MRVDKDASDNVEATICEVQYQGLFRSRAMAGQSRILTLGLTSLSLLTAAFDKVVVSRTRHHSLVKVDQRQFLHLLMPR